MMRRALVATFAAMTFGLATGLALGEHYRMTADPARIAEHRVRPDVATLQEITRRAIAADAALKAITAYYAVKRDYLARYWNEPNETRLRAFFAMYVVHISHPYGAAEIDEQAVNLLDYIRRQPRSHCGTQSTWQGVIAGALGLTWRSARFANGDHGWIEVKVDGRWELFDATTNTWISASAPELLMGATRTYKTFYSPELTEYGARYDLRALRENMIVLGLAWKPDSELVVGG